MEIWKDIPILGLENYEVSDIGNIRHKNNKKNLRFTSNKRTGHLNICINLSFGGKKSFQVHRIVAISFLGLQENKVVNHKNNISYDNKLDNLEWLEPKENSKHYFSKFHIYKTDRKVLSIYRIENIFNSKEWNSAEEFYKELIKLGNESFDNFNNPS